MALLSNHHCNYQSTQSEMLTSYPSSARSYDPLYPSPYNSPSYDPVRIAYRDNCAHENDLTPRRDDMGRTLDYTAESVSEYSKTPDGYDRVPYGVLTPVTPHR